MEIRRSIGSMDVSFRAGRTKRRVVGRNFGSDRDDAHRLRRRFARGELRKNWWLLAFDEDVVLDGQPQLTEMDVI